MRFQKDMHERIFTADDIVNAIMEFPGSPVNDLAFEKFRISDLRDRIEKLHVGDVQKINTAENGVEIKEYILNPYHFHEHIARINSLYNECIEFRKRIEALQVDIFNLSQDNYILDNSTIKLSSAIDQLSFAVHEAEINQSARQGELDHQTKLRDSYTEVLNDLFSDNNFAKSVGDLVKSAVWPLFLSPKIKPEDAKDLVHTGWLRLASLNAAEIKESDPVLDVVQSIRDEFARRNSIERGNFARSLSVAESDLSRAKDNLEAAKFGVQKAKAELLHEQESQNINNELLARKIQQYKDGGVADLNNRIANTLSMYFDAVHEICERMRSVDAFFYGIMGRDVGYAPLSITSSNDAITAYVAAQSLHMAANSEFVPKGFSLDEIGMKIREREYWFRFWIETRKINQVVYSISGEYEPSDTGRFFNLEIQEQKISSPLICLGLSIVNEGEDCSVGISVDLPSNTKFHGQGSADVGRYNISIQSIYAPTTSPAFPISPYPHPLEIVHRDIRGRKRISISSLDDESQQFNLKLVFWTCGM